MAKTAPYIVLLLALSLCFWSVAVADEENGEESEEESPTPSLFDIPTPIPLDMPTPVPMPGESTETEDEAEATPQAPSPQPETMPTPTASAQPLTRQARIEGQIAYKTAADTAWHAEDEDVWTNDLLGYLEGSISWGNQYSALLSGLAEYRQDIGEEARGEMIGELREFYGKMRWGRMDLFVGRQIVSWGVADGFSPLDNLNPYDYRRVIDMELNYARLATFMIRPVVYLGPFQLEAAFMPVFTPPHYDVVGSDWALTGQQFPLGDLLRELRIGEDWRKLESFVAHWIPEWQTDFRRLLDDPDYYTDNTDIPDQDLSAPEGAVRLTYRLQQMDIYLAYFALWDDIPTLHINPSLRDLNELIGQTDEDFTQLPPPDEWPLDAATDPFTLTHHRVHSAGLGLSGTVEDVGLRAEGVVNFDRYTYRRDFSAVKRDSTQWVVNADYTFSGNLLVSGMLIQSYLFDREDDFISRAWRHMLAVGGKKGLLDDRLMVEGIAVLDLTYLNGADWRDFDLTASGWMISPLITYEISDPLKASLGGNFFGGRDDTPLGYLEGNNRVFGLLRYGF